MGKNKHPVECSCQRIERTKQEALIRQQKHIDLVRRLKAEGFSDPAMLNWTFENDNGRSPQMCYAHRYAEQWQTMRSENLGLLFWGGVGTGKSFLAGCIANALMEQEVPVRMTNFARILNELNNSFSGRNDVVDKLCRYPLLIIDDFGMERGTDYALEQIYNIVDSRYRCLFDAVGRPHLHYSKGSSFCPHYRHKSFFGTTRLASGFHYTKRTTNITI